MKKRNPEAIFYMGITFVGVGVVFMTAVNTAIGAAFIALGIMNMILGSRKKK